MYLITIIAAVGGLLFGFDTGIISGALVFLQDSFTLSTFAKECIVASVVLGALLGAVISGSVADHFGRRRMLLFSAVLFVIGTAGSTFAQSIALLILGRLVLGVAIGISSYTVPLYISEMAPAKQRGQLVLISSIAITGGEAIAFLSDYWLAPSASWRAMFALGFIPAVVLFIGMLFLPSTPRWLLLTGRVNKAKQVMNTLKHATDMTHELESLHAIPTVICSGWRTLFASNVRGVLIIGLVLGILQQFTGINTVMYYGPYIFKAAGFNGTQTQILATFILGLANTAMTIVAVYTVDRYGRRRLLKAGMAVSAVSLLLVGILFNRVSTLSHWLMIVCFIVYIAGYAMSLGSIFWLMIAEIYPLPIRAQAMSLVTAIQWGANFFVALTFLTILESVGPSVTFWMYACICMLAIIFTHFWVPETKQVSLEVIQSNLQAGKRLRDIGQAIG